MLTGTMDHPAQPDALSEVVVRVVALNHARRAEKADGVVRWLRPAFQAPTEARAAQRAMAEGAAATALPSWPAREPDRPDIVREMLETVAVLGQARAAPDGSYRI